MEPFIIDVTAIKISKQYEIDLSHASCYVNKNYNDISCIDCPQKNKCDEIQNKER